MAHYCSALWVSWFLFARILLAILSYSGNFLYNFFFMLPRFDFSFALRSHMAIKRKWRSNSILKLRMINEILCLWHRNKTIKLIDIPYSYFCLCLNFLNDEKNCTGIGCHWQIQSSSNFSFVKITACTNFHFILCSQYYQINENVKYNFAKEKYPQKLRFSMSFSKLIFDHMNADFRLGKFRPNHVMIKTNVSVEVMAQHTLHMLALVVAARHV